MEKSGVKEFQERKNAQNKNAKTAQNAVTKTKKK